MFNKNHNECVKKLKEQREREKQQQHVYESNINIILQGKYSWSPLFHSDDMITLVRNSFLSGSFKFHSLRCVCVYVFFQYFHSKANNIALYFYSISFQSEIFFFYYTGINHFFKMIFCFVLQNRTIHWKTEHWFMYV